MNPNPEHHVATILVLEAIAMTMLQAGCSKDEAIEGAAQLFSAAYHETEMYRLECAMADDAK